MTITASGASALQAAPDLPATPHPAECVVAPRTLQEFEGLLIESLTPAAGTPYASPFPQEAILPSGTQADQQTVNAVTAVVHRYIACMNAGNPSFAYALLTDEYLRQQFSESGHAVETLGGVDEFLNAMGLGLVGTPIATPPPEWRGALISIDDTRMLQDGRIGAVVTVEISPVFPSSGTRTHYWIFEPVDDHLLIDDIVDAIPEDADEVGTPESSEP